MIQSEIKLITYDEAVECGIMGSAKINVCSACLYGQYRASCQHPERLMNSDLSHHDIGCGDHSVYIQYIYVPKDQVPSEKQASDI